MVCPKILNKMKKISIILFTVILNAAFLSCDPQDLAEHEIELQACCGDGGDIPPPPPPPDPPIN